MGKIADCCKKLMVMASDKNNADETGLFFSLQPRKTLTFQGHICHGGTKAKQQLTVLLTCNEDGSDKLPL
jgi:hypothetical protein